jgi:hypothetical protein
MKSSAVFDRSREGIGKGSSGSNRRAMFSILSSMTDSVETRSSVTGHHLFTTTRLDAGAPELSRGMRRSSSFRLAPVQARPGTIPIAASCIILDCRVYLAKKDHPDLCFSDLVCCSVNGHD